MFKNFLFGMAAGLAALLTHLAISPAHAKGFYVEGFGGANFESVDYDFGWLTIKDSPGYVGGVAVGTTVDSVRGLRVEGELSFRSNGIDISLCGDPLAAHDRTWALMGNAVYDFDTPSWPVHPYILAGLGYGSRTASLDGYPLELTGQGAVWQVGAGINTKVADGVVLGLGYRFFDAPNIAAAGVENDGHNQSVMATATFLFN